MKTQRLEDLRKLGKTIIQNLNSIGVYSISDLKKVGPVGVYKKITTKYPKKTWPVCYYLYGIEGALTGKHWNDLSKTKKNELLEAGLKHEVHENVNFRNISSFLPTVLLVISLTRIWAMSLYYIFSHDPLLLF